MNKNQWRILGWLWIWTFTLLAWAFLAHWAPFLGHPTSPKTYEIHHYENLSYASTSKDIFLEHFDREELIQKLSQGRPIDQYVLSTFKLNIADLYRLDQKTFSSMILKLLDQKTLLKYERDSDLSGTDAIAQGSRLETLSPQVALKPEEQHRINANTLIRFYDLKLEQIQPSTVQILQAKLQRIGIMRMELVFKAQHDESTGVLFQTANLNQGIRLQLSKTLADTTLLHVLAGSINTHDGLKLSPAHELVLSADIDVEQPHTVELQLDSWGNLSAFLDGNYVGKLDGCVPMLGNVTLGNGYDGYQPFWGMIHLNYLELSALDTPSPHWTQSGLVGAGLGLILALTNLLSLYQLVQYLLFAPV